MPTSTHLCTPEAKLAGNGMCIPDLASIYYALVLSLEGDHFERACPSLAQVPELLQEHRAIANLDERARRADAGAIGIVEVDLTKTLPTALLHSEELYTEPIDMIDCECDEADDEND